ncbi:MAG: UvrB/UvrC motif-containing protein [Candidatus Omnitrophota bacterium]
MLCDICKTNQATVHLTEIVDEEMTELHLCEGCARKKSASMEQHFGLSDLLAGLADLGAQLGEEAEAQIVCSNCGMTYDDFKRIGRLGCSNCYEAFRKSLTTLLKRIQDSGQHIGKTPKGKRVRPASAPPAAQAAPQTPPRAPAKERPKSELEILQEKLRKAIQEEAFEEAAKLRDKIRAFEKKPPKGETEQQP